MVTDERRFGRAADRLGMSEQALAESVRRWRQS
jgi:DNA-binding transcriptional LysR family regulator